MVCINVYGANNLCIILLISQCCYCSINWHNLTHLAPLFIKSTRKPELWSVESEQYMSTVPVDEPA
jgi:hypothetical protein